MCPLGLNSLPHRPWCIDPRCHRLQHPSEMTQCAASTAFPAKESCLCCKMILNLNQFWITLTHRGRDEMAASLQTTIATAFSWIKIFTFWLRFRWNLFASFSITINQHWFRWWPGPKWQTIIWTNYGLVYWRIYASLDFYQLMPNIKLIYRWWRYYSTTGKHTNSINFPYIFFVSTYSILSTLVGYCHFLKQWPHKNSNTLVVFRISEQTQTYLTIHYWTMDRFYQYG